MRCRPPPSHAARIQGRLVYMFDRRETPEATHTGVSFHSALYTLTHTPTLWVYTLAFDDTALGHALGAACGVQCGCRC